MAGNGDRAEMQSDGMWIKCYRRITIDKDRVNKEAPKRTPGEEQKGLDCKQACKRQELRRQLSGDSALNTENLARNRRQNKASRPSEVQAETDR